MSIHPYILKKGKTVYKGDTAQYIRYEKNRDIPTFVHGDEILQPKNSVGRRPYEFVSDTNQPVFFALHAYDAEQYGVIMEFKALCDFKLVEIDNLDTISELYHSVPKDIQRILIQHYGYKPETNTFGIRKSDHDKDNELSTYLCESGYDGYIISSKNIKTDSGKHFHPEIAICRNTHMMKFTRIVSTDDHIDSAIADYHDKLNKPARKSKTTRPMSMYEESSPSKTKSRSMFGDDDDDNDSPNISTRLFGGFGKSKSRRNKSHRNRRTKKSKKNTKKSNRR